MLSGDCTEALSIQANVMISGSSAKLIKNGIAPLPFPLPALLKQYGYRKRGEGQGEGTFSILCNVRAYKSYCKLPKFSERGLSQSAACGQSRGACVTSQPGGLRCRCGLGQAALLSGCGYAALSTL